MSYHCIHLVTSLHFLWSTFLQGRYCSLSFLITKAFSSSRIRRSSSVILVSTRTRISVSLGSIRSLSVCILSSTPGIPLISWLSEPSMGVKTFHLVYSNSTSVINSFVVTTLAWSTGLLSWTFYYSPDSNHSFSVSSSSRTPLVEASHHQFVFSLRPPPSHHHLNFRISFLFPFHMDCFVIILHTFLFILSFCNRFYQNFTVFHGHAFPFLVKS